MWKNISINKSNIKDYVGSSAIINMPHSSDYDGYCFFHPAKLVREGKHSNAVSIGYTDDFKFKLRKYGDGKYNKYEVLHEVTIDAEELEEAFGVINDNISAPKQKNDYETHKPSELEIKPVDALDELKDND